MLSEKAKATIDNLSKEELRFEIAKDRRSRFQREKYAYLKVRLAQLEEEQAAQGPAKAAQLLDPLPPKPPEILQHLRWLWMYGPRYAVWVFLAAVLILGSWAVSRYGFPRIDGTDLDGSESEQRSTSGTVTFEYDSGNGRFVIGQFPWDFETAWTRRSDDSIYIYNDPQSIRGVGVVSGAASFGEIGDASRVDMSSRTQTASEGDFVVLRNSRDFYAALLIMSITDSTRSDSTDEVTFRYLILDDRTADFGSR